MQFIGLILDVCIGVGWAEVPFFSIEYMQTRWIAQIGKSA